MTSTHSEDRLVSGSIHRTVVFIFVFSAVLTSALFASSQFLLPQFTRVEINGEERDFSSLRKEHMRLTAQISQSEQNRRQFLLPVLDSRYRSLVASKDTGHAFLDVFEAVKEVASRFPGNGGPAVSFDSLFMKKGTRTLVMSGRIRNVETRSMTVLAQFSEALSEMPITQSIDTPVFKREFSEAHGFYSPFTITIILK